MNPEKIAGGDIIDRRYSVVEADGRTVTVGQLRRLMGGLEGGHVIDDRAPVMVDGMYVKLATNLNGVLYLDTGHGLPMACPACRDYGCNCGDT